jgi:hypothetical protein
MLRTLRTKSKWGQAVISKTIYPIYFDVMWHRYKYVTAPKLQKVPFYPLSKGSFGRTVPCNVRMVV